MEAAVSELEAAMARHPAGKEQTDLEDFKLTTLDELVKRLTKRFGRAPTEDEVYDFIVGNTAQRRDIWNINEQEKP